MNEISKNYLLEKLHSEYGELAEKIVKGYSLKRKTTFRVNTLIANSEEVETTLKNAGLTFTKWSVWENGYILENGDENDLVSLPLFEDGKIYLQSLSSMLPPLYLDLKEKESVLDMAAAPGGKTSEISALTGDTTPITACEFNKGRAEKLKYNLGKLGVKKVNVMNVDARNLDDFFAFDTVLLDTPCTGSGTVDFSENSRQEFGDGYLQKINRTQTALLQKAVKLLKKGKTMVYSTCSVFKEENERILKSVLKSGAVEIVPIDGKDLPLLPTEIEGTLCVCPNEYYEGFFVAKLRKVK